MLKRKKSEWTRTAEEIFSAQAAEKLHEAKSCNLKDHRHVPTVGGEALCIDCARRLEKERKKPNP